MKPIKFRGRTLYDGGWVYGGFTRDCDGKPMICVAGYACGGTGFDVRHPVEEKTIGQFTGLLDRNDKEIYDDDILRTEQHPGGILPPAPAKTGRVEFHVIYGVVIRFRHDGHDRDSYIRLVGQINEVIGNVHDNPESIPAERSNMQRP
jgi:uncharacterized phage protein (TIGR01671 family)